MHHDAVGPEFARRLRGDSADGKISLMVGLIVGAAVFSVLAVVLWALLRYRKDPMGVGANDKADEIMFPKKAPPPPPKPKEIHVVPPVAMSSPKSPAPLPNQRPRSAPKPKPLNPPAKERPNLTTRERPTSRGRIERGSLRVGSHRPESRDRDLPQTDDDGLGPPRAPPPREPLRPQVEEDGADEPTGTGRRSTRQAWQAPRGQSQRAVQCEKGSAILQELRNSRREPVESRRSRFRKLCLQYHPDKTGTPATMETFQYLQEQKGWYLKT
eukprot:gnl/MRDRNA2_/MRDRNA2_138967_c0_seq1.p1 gnl/MRDRNA2_/MRDRNA2_138967_c0~~gnl/MRDRNA2_/MRDRNA2_138967_c0_seq1.p1  ORF type:complete len:270 (+),score=51.23 gnl/MRDRNA2_/MRDRNA2_138967_c0_seq1:127-936(+)